jgi:hypothetical protein
MVLSDGQISLEFPPFLGVARDLFGSRDVLNRRLFDTVPDYLSAPIWWLTIRRAIEDTFSKEAGQSLAPAADQFEALGHDPVQWLVRVDHGVCTLRE